MKKPILAFALCILLFHSYAQTRVSIAAGLHNTSVTPFLNKQPGLLTASELRQSSLHFGFEADVPINDSKKFSFRPGVFYSSRVSSQDQFLDTSTTKFLKATTENKVNYIDIPLNLIYKLKLKGRTKFILGAGPQASLFYTGSSSFSTIDTLSNFKSTEVTDLPVGKGNSQYRVMHTSIHALAGFEFKRVYLTANFTKNLTPFYEQEGESFKYTTVGATLGIFLGKISTVPAKKAVIDEDRDKDGIKNSDDLCPDQPGTLATQGCPDKDGDGIADANDKCPELAGTLNNGGCPVIDRDKDGVPDDQDHCPDQPGVLKYNGCPIPDTDKDGVNDEEDQCITEAGTKENKGCPEIKKELIEKVSFEARKIQFQLRSDELTKSSLSVLDHVVTLLKETGDLKITIEGHSSLDGSFEANMLLSQKRANRVKNYLIAKGISATRIEAIGYGTTRPLISENNEQANVLNRRVEIKLSR